MKIRHNISLKKYNTFGIDVLAKTFVSVKSKDELLELIKKNTPFFIISGGSNMLLTKAIDELVIHMAIKGIKILKEIKEHVFIDVNSGENWHDFVLWCLEHDFGGIENLSLIPGCVGTSPIQNIGAYGVEVKDVIEEVHVIDIDSGDIKIISNDDCKFGYRDSIFKNEAKGKYIITNVVFKLTKQHHKLNDQYGAIQSELKSSEINEPSIKNISDIIIKIRQQKLPDPKEIGNSGSFFKNPVITKSAFDKLQKVHNNMPNYNVEALYKIPAGWLIEQCGFKGKRFGDAGVHKNQALVLVNYGNATGKEILKLAKKIQKTVEKQFGIHLDMEVNVF
jgi:UDP-N-acetylmuramate dehydrogenase